MVKNARKKKKARLAKHSKSKPRSSARKTKKAKKAEKESSSGDAALALFRGQRYVKPQELQLAMTDAGYSWRAYSGAIAELRDRNIVIVWVWEQKSYTIKPTFMQTYKWCLANYKTVLTILRRSAGAFDVGNLMAKTIKAKAYADAKSNFTAVYNFIKALNQKARQAEREAA